MDALEQLANDKKAKKLTGRPSVVPETALEQIDSSENIHVDVIDSSHLKELPLDVIKVRFSQQRSNKNTSDIDDSIKSQGVIQPIVVRKKGSVYELISGERRFLSAKKNDLVSIPAIIRMVEDEAEFQKLQFFENDKRKNLSLYDECILVGELTEGKIDGIEQLSQKEIEEMLNKSRDWVNSRFSIFSSDSQILELSKKEKDVRKLRNLSTLMGLDKVVCKKYIDLISLEESESIVTRKDINDEISRARSRNNTSGDNTSGDNTFEDETISSPENDALVEDKVSSENSLSNQALNSNETDTTKTNHEQENIIKSEAKLQSEVGKLFDLKVDCNKGKGVICIPYSITKSPDKIIVKLDKGGEAIVFWEEVTILSGEIRE